MTGWKCGIEGCEQTFDDPESTIVHQTMEHQRTECKVCGTVVPEGYFAIRHAFDEHTRAEYVRSYEADSTAVRIREDIKEEVEREADLQDVVERLNAKGGL